jgi:hypothetical protein
MGMPAWTQILAHATTRHRKQGGIMKHKRSLLSIAMATLVLVSLCAVCASPLSVDAAAGSTPFVQASGAPVGSAPALCWRSVNDLDVFVKGTDGALWYKHWNVNSGWSGWTPLGGYVTADPAAISVSGLTAVFVRGGSGSIWTKYTADGGASWTNWGEVGGQSLAGTGPAAYAFNDGSQIGVFVTGTSHALYHLWANSTGVYGWENLGGYLTSSPAATSPTPGWIDVFGRGGNGALWGMPNGGGASWGAWENLGGQIAPGTGPAASSWSSRADIFAEGTSGALYHLWVDSNGWSGWQSLGGYLTSSPAASVLGTVVIDVMVRGGDGNLWVIYTGDGGASWANWLEFGGM